jgi:transcriptional regulator with XRE-family HTH domain
MTPADLKAYRARMGFTQGTLAKKLGRHIRTIAGYERGQNTIPRVVELAVIKLAEDWASKDPFE